MKNIVILLMFVSLFGRAQISVNTAQTPEQLVTNVLAGTGITVSNVTFNGSVALAQTAQVQVGFFSAVGTTFPINNGLILATGNSALAIGPNNMGGATDNTGVATDPNDVDLDAISATTTYNDEAILEFDFVPIGDSLEFKFIFASEEWHEFALGINDGFAFFLSGPGISGPYSNGGENIALLPGTTTPVTMFNVNNGSTNTGPCVNCQYLVDNTGGLDVQYDGHTVILTAAASIQCGQTYHIKLAIGDASDAVLDSGVFLEANSFSSPLPQVSVLPIDENGDVILNGVLPEGCIDAGLLLIKPDGYTDSVFMMDLTIGGTAINGTDYTQLNNSYTIPVGVDTLSIIISAFLDGLVEGNETLILSTYFLSPCGDTIDIIDTLTIVDVAPDYNIIFDDIVLDCPQDSVQIEIGVDGGIPSIDYVWQHSNETTTSVWVPANVFGTNYYPVLTTDYCGITAFDSVKVTVNTSVLPTITFIDDYIFTCVGQNGVNLAVDSIGNAFDSNAITYTWMPSAGNQDNINVFPTNANNWYYLTVYDGCNTVTDSVQVEVGTTTVDSIITVPAQGCANQGNAAGSISVYPLAANWSYTLVGNGGVVGPQVSNVFTNLTGNVSYNLLATDPQGCILDVNVFVPQVNATLNAVLDPLALKDVLCFGSANGEAGVISITGGINTPSPGPFNILWTHSDGTNINGGQNIPLNGGDNVNTLYVGNWQVLIVEQGSQCAWSQSFTIGEPDIVTASIVGSDTICNGTSNGSMNVFGYGGTGNYSVNVEDAQGNIVSIPGTSVATDLSAGQYTYTVTDDNGCSANGIANIIARQEIKISFDQVNILCYGRNTASVNITGAQNYAGSYADLQFLWTPSISGGDGPGKTSESNMGPGDYVIEFQDSKGCISDTVVIILDADPIVLTLNKTSAFCRTASFQNGNGSVGVSADGGAGNFSLLWENLTTGETENTPLWAALNPGDYKVTVIDNNNCLASEIIQLDSVDVVADFYVTSDDFYISDIYEGDEELKIKLHNESLNYKQENNPSSLSVFQWNLNSKGVNDEDRWFFTYDIGDKPDTIYSGVDKNKPTVYEVCLIAKNYNDCSDMLCKEILVHKRPELFLPNVFTPGVEPNNTFYFPNIGIEDFKATVYNRYGVKVFEFNAITDEWNGDNMKNDLPCSDGVYFYKFEGKSTNGTPYSGEGSVTIIRGK